MTHTCTVDTSRLCFASEYKQGATPFLKHIITTWFLVLWFIKRKVTQMAHTETEKTPNNDRKLKRERSRAHSVLCFFECVRHRSHWKCVWWALQTNNHRERDWIKKKTCKPSYTTKYHLQLRKSTWKNHPLLPPTIPFTGWGEVSGGPGRCVGRTASLRRWTTSGRIAGGQSCGKTCCWSEPPRRRDVAGSGWKSGRNTNVISGSTLVCFKEKNSLYFTLTTALMASWPH